jgi:hypothetical protein
MDSEIIYLLTKDELESLLSDSVVLRAIEGAGVDNWSGYELAMEYCDIDEEVKEMLGNYKT